MAKRRWLNREHVIEAAVTLADEAGNPNSVTLTQLAEKLDIRVPSLYNHVANLEDLRHGMAVYGGRRLIDSLREASLGKIGREALGSMAGAYRDFAHQHPGIYPLIIRAPDPEDRELVPLAQELLQMLLLVMASLGLQGDIALHAVRGIRAVLHGFVTLEAAEGFKMALDEDESFYLLLNNYLNGLATND